MTARDERLRQFFSGYFNQDWDMDGVESWRTVIADFVRSNPRAQVLGLIEDLRSWTKDAAIDKLDNLPPAFGCDYDPRPDGQTERGWVEQLTDAMAKQLSN
jgi:hypothetical protein